MANRTTVVANAIGDSFLNRCFENIDFVTHMGHPVDAFFGWLQPYPLLILLIILLMVLPSIFRYGSNNTILKIVRIYNFTRLGVISLFHQGCYSYTIGTPLVLIFAQPTPCVHTDTFGVYTGLYMFPDNLCMSAALFAFSVARYSSVKPIIGIPIATFLLLLFLFSSVVTRQSTVFQTLSSISFSYIVHFAHVHVPFKYIHIENGVWIVFNIGGVVAAIVGLHLDRMQAFLEVWFSFVLIAIDELFLITYQLTRGGFTVIERPADLSWSVAAIHSESVRLLNSEAEAQFVSHILGDTGTSGIAFVIFFLGVLIRLMFSNAFFPSVS
jgi:hypothetical protein